MKSFALKVFLSTILCSAVVAEIKTFNSVIEATSEFVQFTSGFLVDPGYVDLSTVKLVPFGDSYMIEGDDYVDNDDGELLETDDEFNDKGTSSPTASPTVKVTESPTPLATKKATVTNAPTPLATKNAETDVTTAPSAAATDAATEKVTEAVTEKVTDAATDAVTEKVTDAATEKTTVKATEKVTSPPEAKAKIEEDDYYDDDEGAKDVVTAAPIAKMPAVVEEGDDYYDDDTGERKLAGDNSVVELLFFHQPADCEKTKAGCDWPKLGVGARDNIGTIRYCCTEDAIVLGICEQDRKGRVIINESTYTGEIRPVLVPSSGSDALKIESPIMDTNKAGTGTYTLVLANCDDYGRSVLISGQYVWKSKGGYLPGDLFDEWHFLTFFTIGYFLLMFWYGKSMKDNSDSTIGIQKWILGTIILGLLQLILKGIDYMEWNMAGTRIDGVMYSWITIGVLKGAISRCLLVMVSLGWGVIRDDLGDQMKKIIGLGIIYSVFAFSRDVAEIIFVEELQTLSVAAEEKIYDVFTILTFITAAIDVTFYMWILDALNNTMQYLENMNQSMKLKRYLRLRLILLFSILFGIGWSVFEIVDKTMEDQILSEGQDWLLRALWTVNYTFVLVSIALLWKPDPRAKEFAYVMELPSIGDDMILETSIDSPDDNDGVNVQYSDAVNSGQDNRFTIDDGVAT